MTGRRPLGLIAALMVVTLAPSCKLFRRQPKAAAPPAPAPAKPSRPAQKPAGEQVALPAPPQISPQNPDLTNQPPAPPSAEKLPPPPRRRGSRPSPATAQTAPAQQTPVAQQPPAQQPAAEENAAAEVPELEQILSPEQRQAYIAEIEMNVGRAQKTVDTLQGRRLNRDQKTYLARIRAFIDQTKEARKTDLFRAKTLSERASVLAEDLLHSVQ